MAQLISVKLSRFDASPWGFRLQGGKDFGAPLLIQKDMSRNFCRIILKNYKFNARSRIFNFTAHLNTLLSHMTLLCLFM
ncbi:hypothetical protein L9F63_002380, partial [Diploptera punctata]